MRLCERGLNFLQITTDGNVGLCPWRLDNIIGNLYDSTLEEIWHGDKAEALRKKLMDGNYSACHVDSCPYLSMGDIDNHMAEVEKLPDYPQELYMAFETVCNYNCTCCICPEMMQESKTKNTEDLYRLVEERLQPILPHVKVISASGFGELFASKHTLNLLANWHPLAPKEECYVELETNGSLFDAEHWKQISNLGQYHLRVDITVMSFEEKIYQILSGTKLPISQIENNLRFVKSLREQGIINYLEIATVYQERNFRSLPEFARRCVEEFGADYVRLRPYLQMAKYSPDIEWFTDVRGKYHPYHQEFLEVMKDPIFQHPKVHDWGGGLDSTLGKLPSQLKAESLEPAARLSDKRAKMLNQYRDFCAKLLSSERNIKALREILQGKNFLIYGLGKVGKELVDKLGDYGLKGILDEYSKEKEFLGFSIYRPVEAPTEWHDYDIVVTPLTDCKEICGQLTGKGFKGSIIDVYEVVQRL